jgi:RNase P subunit RPR2
MLFEKFSNLISKFLPAASLSDKESQALARLNPDKIYIENVRSILDVSSKTAEEVCETAVRRGVFKRCIEVLCPDGAVAVTAESEKNLPPTVNCLRDEDGHFSEIELPTETLQKVRFYRLT